MPIFVGSVRRVVRLRSDIVICFVEELLRTQFLGTAPDDIDELFPPRKLPDASSTLDSTLSPVGPVATGTGFFTPEPSAGPRKPQLGGGKDNRVLRMELLTGSVYVPLLTVSPSTTSIPTGLQLMRPSWSKMTLYCNRGNQPGYSV